MENKDSLHFLSLCLYLSTVAAGAGLPSDKWALGGLRICWRTAGFPVCSVWSSQTTSRLQATTSPLIMVPVCARPGGTCHPAMTVCSALLPHPVPPSLHFLCSQWFLNSGYRQLANSTLCALVISRLSHLLLPPVPVPCQHLPYCLRSWLCSFRGERIFFLISGCCWTVTQLNSDIWEICHLSLRWFTILIAAKIFNHPVLRCVVCGVYCSKNTSFSCLSKKCKLYWNKIC